MRKGIILAGGNGSRLYPLTIATSKQLMPIYDKPMIYYPIATLMQAGIRELIIITKPSESEMFKRLLSDGRQWGIHISYLTQEHPEGIAQAFLIAENLISNSPCALALGDNLFYGQNLTKQLQRANDQYSTSTVFAYHVSNPSDYGVIEFSKENIALSIEEKPARPKSNYAVPGLYFFDENVVQYAKGLTPSGRGELEITDIISQYLSKDKLSVEVMGRGTAWLDTGTPEQMLAASQYVATLEQRQGLKICCLEEVAYQMKYISGDQLMRLAEQYPKSSYKSYLLSIVSQ